MGQRHKLAAWSRALVAAALLVGLAAASSTGIGRAQTGAPDRPGELSMGWPWPAPNSTQPHYPALVLGGLPGRMLGVQVPGGGGATGVPSGAVPADSPTVSTLAAGGIPSVALDAYRRAAARTNAEDPDCRLPWPLLAAIGRVESDHGRFAGAQLRVDGTSTIKIIGIPLNGIGTALIPDTDGGRLDRDTVYDRAVGAMQFIPSTWAGYGVDGNGDGVVDPYNIFDAALAAAHYLCAAGGDLRTSAGQIRAVLAYNHSSEYLHLVLALEAAYAAGRGVVVPVVLGPEPVPTATPTMPPVNPAPPPAVHRTTPKPVSATPVTKAPGPKPPANSSPVIAAPATPAQPTSAVPATSPPAETSSAASTADVTDTATTCPSSGASTHSTAPSGSTGTADASVSPSTDAPSTTATVDDTRAATGTATSTPTGTATSTKSGTATATGSRSASGTHTDDPCSEPSGSATAAPSVAAASVPGVLLVLVIVAIGLAIAYSRFRGRSARHR